MTSYPIFTGTIDTHYADAREHFDYLVGRLNHEESRKLTHGEVEDLINTEGMELLRRLNQAYLERRSTEEPIREHVVGEDGVITARFEGAMGEEELVAHLQ